ncbi:hypothetical protein [Dietzia psychralcaliphila]|uniref:hypothetical protein n=1 Tax=Dietzia psychralcaliphila TaxID=139021 RepID=UPI001C1DFA7A|nr:hypothetical protein [Dietzia psychralcaliphila]
MPPIKRTQKSVNPAPRRRLAGHARQTRPEGGTATDPTSWDARDDEVGGDGTGAGRGERRAGRRPGGRTIAYSAIATGLAAGAIGAFLATEPGVDVDNRAFVDREATEKVLSAATTNVQRLVAIDHETLDEYHDSLGEFLTPKLVNELDENWPALRESYEQSATSVDAEVREAGLAYLQGDKAEVLLVQDVSMTRDGAAAGSTSGTYLVGLDKIDGVWKLSRIPDLPS